MAEKSPQAFRTIREVAEWLGIEAHVLRFWESKFNQIKPVKRAGGRRYYRPADMRLIGGIKVLLHEQGLTIRGVQKKLADEGAAAIAALSPPLAEELEAEAAATVTVGAEDAPATDDAATPQAGFFDIEALASGTAQDGAQADAPDQGAAPTPISAADRPGTEPTGARPGRRRRRMRWRPGGPSGRQRRGRAGRGACGRDGSRVDGAGSGPGRATEAPGAEPESDAAEPARQRRAEAAPDAAEGAAPDAVQAAPPAPAEEPPASDAPEEPAPRHKQNRHRPGAGRGGPGAAHAAFRASGASARSGAASAIRSAAGWRRWSTGWRRSKAGCAPAIRGVSNRADAAFSRSFPLAQAGKIGRTAKRRAMAQPGSASVWGTEGRRFESC